MTTKQSRFALLTLLASAWLLSAATLVQAQTKTTVHYKEVHHQIEGHVFPVGDVPGHLYGVWVRKGLTIFAKGEVATYSALGDLDITKGKGTISGYDTTTFADGSSWSTKFEGQFSVDPNGLWVIPHKGHFVKGTGRFEGIEGSLRYTSKQIDKGPEFKGLAETEGVASYTLPSKPSK
jgi:hypothetical protein